MNEFEGKRENGGSDELRGLRLLVAAAILLMCVFIGCIDVTLRRQFKNLDGQLDAAQKNWDNYERTEQKAEQMRFNYFFGALNEYAKTHPDFQPTMQTVDRYLNGAQGGAMSSSGKK